MLKSKCKKSTCVSYINASLALAPLTFRNSRFNGHFANQAFFQHGFIIDPTMNLVWDINDRKPTWLTPWEALILLWAKLISFYNALKNNEADLISQQGSDEKEAYIGIVKNNILKVLSTDLWRFLTPFQISTRSPSVS